MEYKKLDTIMLHTVTKESVDEINFYRELNKDEEIGNRLHGLNGILLPVDKYPFLGRAFLTSLNGELFGYLHIGNLDEVEKSVYLKAGIHPNKRNCGLGKLLLKEVTDYIFLNHQEVEMIKLRIASDNKASIYTANACGYTWLVDEYYVKYNPYLEESKKNNPSL